MANLIKYGVIAAGCEPSTMSKWPLAAFRVFTPELVHHLTARHIAALSPRQLSAIPIDSWSVLEGSQLNTAPTGSRLSQDQVATILAKTEESLLTLRNLVRWPHSKLHSTTKEVVTQHSLLTFEIAANSLPMNFHAQPIRMKLTYT